MQTKSFVSCGGDENAQAENFNGNNRRNLAQL